MRKIIMIFVIATFAMVNANAQNAGRGNVQQSSSNIYVGGGIVFESTSDETAIAVVPEIGYQKSEKWGIGARFGFGSQGSGDSKYTIISFKPYVRQNIMSFGKIDLIFDYQLLYQNEGVKDNKTNTFGLGVSPGLSVKLNNSLSVVTHLGVIGYTSSKLDVEGSEAVNKFSVKAGTENLGLSIYYNF